VVVLTTPDDEAIGTAWNPDPVFGDEKVRAMRLGVCSRGSEGAAIGVEIYFVMGIADSD